MAEEEKKEGQEPKKPTPEEIAKNQEVKKQQELQMLEQLLNKHVGRGILIGSDGTKGNVIWGTLKRLELRALLGEQLEKL